MYVARESLEKTEVRAQTVKSAIERGWIPSLDLDSETIVVDYECGDSTGEMRTAFATATNWGREDWDVAVTAEVCISSVGVLLVTTGISQLLAPTSKFSSLITGRMITIPYVPFHNHFT